MLIDTGNGSKTEINHNFLTPFSSSILNILSTMAMVEATEGEPYIKNDENARGDVTGLIGMVGEKTRGTFAITFTEPVIMEVLRNMLGEDESEINETVTDMVGEITNMVCGGAKKLLSEEGYRFDMAIPSVVAGKNHVIRHKSKSPIIIVPFKAGSGEFFIEVCFE